MNRARFLGVVGLFLWLSCTPRLFVLPPDEVMRTVKFFEKSLSESGEQFFEQKDEPEWRHEMKQYIATAKDHEKVLWIKWLAYLALICSAIIGWLLFILAKPISKGIILSTTVVLVSSTLLLNFVVYEGFLTAITKRSLSLFPWEVIISTTYYYFLLPLLLISASIKVMNVKE